MSEECEHNATPLDCFVTIKGIRRVAIQCPLCGEILDYRPQYEGD